MLREFFVRGDVDMDLCVCLAEGEVFTYICWPFRFPV